MGGIIHIAEIAALLLVAYSIGWGLGYVARRLSLGRTRAGAAIPAARLVLAKGESEPHVAASALTVASVVAEAIAPSPAATESPAGTEGPVAARQGPPSTEPTVAESGERPPAMPTPAPSTAVVPETDPVAVDDPLRAPQANVVPPAIEPEVAAEQAVPAEPAIPEPVEAAAVASPPASAAIVHPADGDDEFVVLGRPVAAGSSIEPGPASVPGVAWSGDINGHAAPEHAEITVVARGAAPPTPDTPVDSVTVASAAVSPPAMTGPSPRWEPAADEPAGPASGPAPDMPRRVEPDIVVPGRTPARAIVDAEAMVAAMVAPRPVVPETDDIDSPVIDLPGADEAAAAPEQSTDGELAGAAGVEPSSSTSAPPPDEDAAMRAIEGGWSRTTSGPDQPPAIDPAATAAAAVAAAQAAVEQVVATVGHPAAAAALPGTPEAGRPPGVLPPRDGRRDNLKEISGLGALDESTLNNLGIYYFEQLAEWTPAEVLWLESNVFARGRIGRESWREQARELAEARPSPRLARS